MHSVAGSLGDVDLPFLRAVVHPAAAQLHVVGQPQGPRRARTSSRAASSGSTTSACSTAAPPLPTGGRLEQADGTAWMALFSQNMLELALALTDDDPDYADFVFKFVEHFFWIAAAVDPIGDHPDEMWDDEDGFFYDVLRRPDGTGERLKVRSLVGLLPLCATTVISAEVLEQPPRADAADRRPTCERNRDLLANIADPFKPGVNGRRLLSLVNEDKLRRILTRMLDEERFLGPHGIRSISRVHLDEPYECRRRGQHLPRAVRAGRVDDGHVRRQLELARAGVVPGQPADRPGAAAALPLLRRRLHDRVPDRVGQPDDAVRGRQGDRRPARSPRSCAGPDGTPAGVRRHRAVPATTRTGAT